MEKCFYYSTLPEGPDWAQCNKTGGVESAVLVPWQLPPCLSGPKPFQFEGFPSLSMMPIEGLAEEGGVSASKSHSQAEKRRRDRINAQLATLRKLIPKSEKMDKAALLGSVIDHVKDLKRKAMEVGKAFIVPTDTDEVSIDCDFAEEAAEEEEEEEDEEDTKSAANSQKSRENILIKASVCCDDRPELLSELIQVLRSLRLKAVKADMASVGGRIKSILVLCTNDRDEGVCLTSLQQSLKLLLGKITSSSMASTCRIRSKRQRFFLPSRYSE